MASAKMKIERGLSIEGWILVEEIGAGGNGSVWRAEKASQTDCAIKILRNLNKESLARFNAEIKALGLLKGVSGIIPIIDSNMDKPKSGGLIWYRMPVAKGIEHTITSLNSPDSIVREFVSLGEALISLHDRQLYHRDIKPQNLLTYDGRLCFADFGLVKFPQRQSDITPSKRDVGPKFVMAPEMRRTAKTAEGGPADVYSFAKTLWIVLTGNKYAFDGQYSPFSSVSLRCFRNDIYTYLIDDLIAECTDNNPASRPSIRQVVERLEEWLTTASNFQTRNLKEWAELQTRLFPSGSPRSATWTNTITIACVLNMVAGIDQLNHMFMPSGGGMTLKSARESHLEKGFIILDVGWECVLKPSKLSFETFDDEPSWNFFRLEADDIAASGVRGAILHNDGLSEELCVIAEQAYLGADRWYDESKPLPKDGKLVVRFLKGSFVIFSTRSPYNLSPNTYDARHNKMSEQQFRAYIERNLRLVARPKS